MIRKTEYLDYFAEQMIDKGIINSIDDFLPPFETVDVKGLPQMSKGKDSPSKLADTNFYVYTSKIDAEVQIGIDAFIHGSSEGPKEITHSVYVVINVGNNERQRQYDIFKEGAFLSSVVDFNYSNLNERFKFFEHGDPFKVEKSKQLDPREAINTCISLFSDNLRAIQQLELDNEQSTKGKDYSLN